eukprot:6065544-Alexandrium_andersonii.AAC.1
MGCPERVVRAREQLYHGMVRHMRLGKLYGSPMPASNGVGQGCPWSIDDIAVIMSAWARRMARVVPRALCA